MKNSEQQIKNGESIKELGFALPKRNILYIIAGFVVMLIGYLLMIGGGSKDSNIFNDAMFSTTRIVIAPIAILIGISVVIWAIMYKGKIK